MNFAGTYASFFSYILMAIPYYYGKNIITHLLQVTDQQSGTIGFVHKLISKIFNL